MARINHPKPEDDPGLIFEELAKTVLESPYLIFNRARRKGETCEIDLDFTVRKISATLFAEFSYLLIVECKNWKKKVNTLELRVFCSKMQNVDSKVGIFFSKNGITRDAIRFIRDAWIQHKIVIIVFDVKDLEKIINGTQNFYKILQDKYLAVRTASTE